jgi:hypothetical protein
MCKRNSALFNFNYSSGWSFENELRCLIIFKKLEIENFTRGMQSDLCQVLALSTDLSFETIKAKVGNYKSELGVNNPSNSSEATKFIAENFGTMGILEAEALLTGYLLGKQENTS